MVQEFRKVAQVDEVLPGDMRLVEFNDERVLLVNLDGNFYAVSEMCPHAGGLLSEGDLEGESVGCPLHGSLFSVKTGMVETPPADEDLTVYQVKIEGGDILIAPV